MRKNKLYSFDEVITMQAIGFVTASVVFDCFTDVKDENELIQKAYELIDINFERVLSINDKMDEGFDSDLYHLLEREDSREEINEIISKIAENAIHQHFTIK